MAGKPLVTPKAIIAGVVTAVVICGGMYWLAASAELPIGFITFFPGLFFGAMVTYLLSNLSGTRKVASASAAERAAALAVTVPPGKALIFLYRRGFMGALAGMDVGIDGTPVAQLKSPRFTCLAVSPGPHRIDVAFSGLAGAQNKSASIDVVAAAGHAHAYRIAARMGMLAGSTVLIPTEMPEAVAAMRGMRMVRPDVPVP